LRDSEDPLRRVFRRYAGANGKCDSNVKIRSIEVGRRFRSYLSWFVKTDGRLGVTSEDLSDLIRRLEEDARSELDRLIRETAGTPRCYPRPLRKEDVLAHEQVLVGQYGLFVRRAEDGSELPILSNGKILGFYMGALLDNDHDLARTEVDHPNYELYAIDASPRRGRVTYSGVGATNSLAFANTALKADDEDPAYDTDRINALFMDFSVGLSDNKGKPARESLVAMVALDNLFVDNRVEAQVLVDYGPPFLENFKAKPQPGESSTPAAVKSEPEEEPLQESGRH
jgi:hypothetical protein